MKNDKNNKPGVLLHGECMIIETDSIPNDAVPFEIDPTKIIDKNKFIIAESEVVGNHHVVRLGEGVSLFRDSKGVMFMSNEVPVEVSCVITNRHHTKTLPPGKYEFGYQEECDHLTRAKRHVAD